MPIKPFQFGVTSLPKQLLCVLRLTEGLSSTSMPYPMAFDSLPLPLHFGIILTKNLLDQT